MQTSPDLLALVGSFTVPGEPRSGLALLTAGERGLTVDDIHVERRLVSPSYLVSAPSTASAPRAASPLALDLLAIEAEANALTALRWSPEDPLRATIRQSVPVGHAPCFVGLDAGGERGVVCSYGDGRVTSFQRSPDGELGDVRHHLPPSAAGDERPRRAHGVVFDGEHVLTTDLGHDRVHLWRWRTEGGLDWLSSTPLPRGMGPRTIVRHPAGPVHVSGEGSGEVAILVREGNELHRAGHYRSPGPPRAHEAAATIVLSPDGRESTLGLRARHRIARFTVAADGLSAVPRDEIESGGREPRHHLATSAALLIANLGSNEIVWRPTDPRRPRGPDLPAHSTPPQRATSRTRSRVSTPRPSCISPVPPTPCPPTR